MTDHQKNEIPEAQAPGEGTPSQPVTEEAAQNLPAQEASQGQSASEAATGVPAEAAGETALVDGEPVSAPEGEGQYAPGEEALPSQQAEAASQEEAPQPVEPPVPDTAEPEYPRQEASQPAPPPQQPWPGVAPGYGGAYPPPQGQWVQGYYPQQPWYGPAYGQVPAPYGPVRPPRKKMSRGLKVFLWIASALTAGVILGFTAFVVSWAVAGPQTQVPVVDTLPDEGQQEESQDFLQEEEPQLDLPDVDVTPNEEGIVIHQKPEGDALDAQEVYDKVVKSTVAITVSYTGEGTDSSGTGIIATSDGYIITNAHVVLNTKSVLVTVTTYDGQQYDAVVVGMDRTTDLAIIKTNDYGFTPAEFGDAGELSIGEWVLAIGNPGGERFSSSLTRGIVSGLDRAVERYSEDGMTFIQTDAAINPGNSGGPLVNMYGQVVGINSSKIITDGYEGMGFAIPVSKAKDIIDQLLSGGYVEGRVRLGISGYDLGDEAAFYGLPKGFMIASIDEDSSFAGTEAQVEDIIIAIDGETVEELQDISNLLLRYSPGDQVTVTLYRRSAYDFSDGEEIEVTITLLEDKGETQR